jgi:pSer/pThr/pTyr-binding forkhead associated (FHA) protein
MNTQQGPYIPSPEDSEQGTLEQSVMPPPPPTPKKVVRTPTLHEAVLDEEIAPGPAPAPPSLPPAEAPTRPPSARKPSLGVGSGPRRVPTSLTPPPEPDTDAFRPSQRPALALLCILDDGADDGEWVRLRAEKTLFGRVEGDVVIPHDPLISSRHAELTRQMLKTGTCWDLRDLDSTNGTFVRIHTAALESGQQLLLGGRHYRFDDPMQQAAKAPPTVAGGEDAGGTATRRALGDGSQGCLLPSLVELTKQGEGRRFVVAGSEVWIGRDPKQCTVAIPDDPMVSPRHARLYRDAKGRWMMQDAPSRNGVWFSVHKVRFKRTTYFQLGEQRFLLKIT